MQGFDDLGPNDGYVPGRGFLRLTHVGKGGPGIADMGPGTGQAAHDGVDIGPGPILDRMLLILLDGLRLRTAVRVGNGQIERLAESDQFLIRAFDQSRELNDVGHDPSLLLTEIATRFTDLIQHGGQMLVPAPAEVELIAQRRDKIGASIPCRQMVDSPAGGVEDVTDHGGDPPQRFDIRRRSLVEHGKIRQFERRR